MASGQIACILLATYNGERFLRAQLDSILMQSHGDWILYVRDDGSSDSTVEIIGDYASRDSRIRFLRDEFGPTGSASGNFNLLMLAALRSHAAWFFFCDQDDVWHPDKLEMQMRLVASMGTSRPCLAHHDLKVVRENLAQLHPSFFSLMRLAPEEASFNSLLGRNEVTGCTVACNRHLLECAVPVPSAAIMHDWWLALIAAATGGIAVQNTALIDYRQHSNNTVGAKSFWSGLNPFTNWLAGWRRGNREFLSTISQASALQHHFQMNPAVRCLVPSQVRATLQEYVTILEKPPFQRLRYAKAHGLLKRHWLLNLVNRARLLTITNKN